MQWADAYATKSGGRQPAVRVGNTFAQTQAHLFGRPPTVYLRIALALALYRYHGGLTPPALACRCDGRRWTCAESPMQTRLPNHGGLTPPALVLVYGRLRAKKRFLRCANAHSQERRASARRGSVTHLQRRFVEATGRRNRRAAISLLQTRLANHGWLTPAAPPCMPECRRKDAFFHPPARFFFHGWLTPAAPGARRLSLQHARFAIHNAHATKSGGRQPAVVR
jgi:hypothetical protein